jgi:hypothetical protein
MGFAAARDDSGRFIGHACSNTLTTGRERPERMLRPDSRKKGGSGTETLIAY